ncbi:MAG: methyltransferase family protein [Roseibacillus sp.]
MNPLVIEAVALYWPILTALILGFVLRINRREGLGVLYAVLWNLATLPCLNGIAEWAGWWNFVTSSPRFGGLPLSLWFGWAALWGALACIISQKLPLWLTITIMILLDLVTMPLLEPLLILKEGWLEGEVLMIAGALVPGLFLYRWTSSHTHLGPRTMLIATGFAILALIHIPLAAHSGSWKTLFESFASVPLLIQLGATALALLPAIPAILAVREFVVVGKGTPVPMDAPIILVTTGVYRRIRNPMQFGITSLLLIEAALFWNLWIALCALSIVAYSLGFARWSEDADMRKRFGQAWDSYRKKVPAWRFSFH